MVGDAEEKNFGGVTTELGMLDRESRLRPDLSSVARVPCRQVKD